MQWVSVIGGLCLCMLQLPGTQGHSGRRCFGVRRDICWGWQQGGPRDSPDGYLIVGMKLPAVLFQ